MKVKNLIIEYSFFLIFDFSFGERWLHSFLQTWVTYNSLLDRTIDAWHKKGNWTKDYLWKHLWQIIFCWISFFFVMQGHFIEL